METLRTNNDVLPPPFEELFLLIFNTLSKARQANFAMMKLWDLSPHFISLHILFKRQPHFRQISHQRILATLDEGFGIVNMKSSSSDEDII
jgi:hypothetical protein